MFAGIYAKWWENETEVKNLYALRYAENLKGENNKPHWRIVGYDGFPSAYTAELFPGVHVPDEFKYGCTPPTSEQVQALRKVQVLHER